MQEGNASTNKKHNGTLSLYNLVPHQRLQKDVWIRLGRCAMSVAQCIIISVTKVTQSQSVDFGQDHKVTGNLAA